jgi:hypothetical protein
MTNHTDETYLLYSFYVRDLADSLGLRDWRIDLSREVLAEGYGHATVWKDSTRVEMALAVHEDEEELRDTVIHELLHCYNGHADQLIADMLETEVHPSVWDVFTTAHQRMVERAVDQLSRSISEFLPLLDRNV